MSQTLVQTVLPCFFKVDQLELVLVLHLASSRPDSGAHAQTSSTCAPFIYKQSATTHTKLPPTMTSIISLVRLDERTVRWNTQANGWTATASSRDLAQRCPGVAPRLARRTAGLPPPSLTHRWDSNDRSQVAQRAESTHTHTLTDSGMSHLNLAGRFYRLGITWLPLAQPAFSSSQTLFNLGSLLCAECNHTTAGLTMCS